MKAKVLLRRLWSRDEYLGWDEEIPEAERKEWIKFFRQMSDLERLKFPRPLTPPQPLRQPSLVVFSGASINAYGAVAYVRWETGNKKVFLRLIASKNRIAPIKIMDIVRLELRGAVLSTRLRRFIQWEMRFEFRDVFHIVDSEIVKAMISKNSYGFNTFVATRIKRNGIGRLSSLILLIGWLEGSALMKLTVRVNGKGAAVLAGAYVGMAYISRG